MKNRLRMAFATVSGALLLVFSLTAGSPASAATNAYKTDSVAMTPGSATLVSAAASPNCGKGVGPRKVVGTYKTKQVGKGGYRTVTLYCGNNSYGYRHLEPHVGQYFGGWGNFNFSIAATLKAPGQVVTQTNGNYRYSAPVYQCFYEGYYYIWTFYVVRTIVSGSIVTAYGSKGKRVNTSCP
jgi:hypothetical protein